MKIIIAFTMLTCIMHVPVWNFAQPPRPPYPLEVLIKNHAALPNIHPYTGDVTGSKATASGGNKIDGTGFFMTGTLNSSFFYFVSRKQKVYANWGAIRDKYTK